jgi:hypothetical protein
MKRAHVLAFAAAVILPACEPAGGDGVPTASRPSASLPAATSPPPTLSAEGFLYTSNEGIRALATFEGDGGTLELENTTGAELEPPGLYLLDAATGEIVDATVTPSRAVPDGDERTFRVALDRAMPPASIGLVVLTIGEADHGAFLPPAAEEGAA